MSEKYHSAELSAKPNWRGIFRLHCPYCLDFPLPRAFWKKWPIQCQRCQYHFEREEGYFSGVTWIFSYLAGALLGGVTWILLRSYFIHEAYLIAMVCLSAVSASLLALPYGKWMWIFFDHTMNPLNPDDFRNDNSDIRS
jgi:hypothetical protein